MPVLFNFKISLDIRTLALRTTGTASACNPLGASRWTQIMKRTFAIFFVLQILTGCSDTIKDESSQENKVLTNSILSEMVKTTEQDTGFDNRLKNNKFQNDISDILKDSKLSRKIEGTWELTSDYSLVFLSTKLNPHYEVVFNDSVSTALTGWGKLIYNASAKFYSTEHASDMYEYYVGKNGRLILTHFDYLNNDLTHKSHPDLDTISFAILFPDKDIFVLSDGFEKFKFIRTNEQ